MSTPPPHSHSKRKSAASLAMEGGGERVGVSISQTKMGHLSSMRFCFNLFASWDGSLQFVINIRVFITSASFVMIFLLSL